ncbi:hypothetical protein BC832DRAFT_567136 [Gaertneriomyces semiglobifer]|nr:hypothetical protein BC832DRAFT_567136 [Gaertneriomyces semiglobifer]
MPTHPIILISTATVVDGVEAVKVGRARTQSKHEKLCIQSHTSTHTTRSVHTDTHLSFDGSLTVVVVVVTDRRRARERERAHKGI